MLLLYLDFLPSDVFVADVLSKLKSGPIINNSFVCVCHYASRAKIVTYWWFKSTKQYNEKISNLTDRNAINYAGT